MTVVGANSAAVNALTVGDIILCGPDKLPIKVAAIATPNITLQKKYIGNTVTGLASVTRRWEFHDYFSSAPGTSAAVSQGGGSFDEMHVVVADEDGLITGTANTIVEIFPSLSKASSTRSEDGTLIYYKDYINRNSRWIWWAAHASNVTNWGKIGRAHV